MDFDIKSMMHIFKNAKEVKPGERIIVKCDKCGHDLSIGRAPNGHIYAKCSGCGITLIQ